MPVRRNRIVVGEDGIVLESEHRKQFLVERLLVKPEERQDRGLAPLGEPGRSAREVRIVRLEHRDRHAEHGCDLLDDLVATAEILRRELHRLEVDLTGERDELAGLVGTAEPLVHHALELGDSLLACVRVLDRREVVRPGLVRGHRGIHLVERGVQVDDTPRRLDLAEPVVEVFRVRPFEMQHLVRLKGDAAIRFAAVLVAGDECRLARDDLDPLRRHRPEFSRHAELVPDDPDIGVPGQLLIQSPGRRQVEPVHRRVHLAEQVEHGMRLGDFLEVSAEVVHLRQHRPARRSSGIADEVRLPVTADPRGPVEPRACTVPDIEPERNARHAEGVDVRGCVDPRTELANAGDRGVERPLAQSRAARDHAERCSQVLAPRVCRRRGLLPEQTADSFEH